MARRKVCDHCGSIIKTSGLSKKEFAAKVKVGTVLAGYSTGKLASVLAIAENRFIYKDSAGRERVGTIGDKSAKWRIA